MTGHQAAAGRDRRVASLVNAWHQAAGGSALCQCLVADGAALEL